MRKSAFYWFWRVLAGLVALLLIAVAGLYFYIENNYERLLREAALRQGLDVDYEDLDFRWWQDFPKARLQAAQLVVQDTAAFDKLPPLLELEHFSVQLGMQQVLNRHIYLDSIELIRGQVHLERVGPHRFNAGRLFRTDPDSSRQSDQESGFTLDPRGLHLLVQELDIYHRDTSKQRLFDLQIERLSATGDESPRGEALIEADLLTHVTGLAMNTDKGSYLRNSRLEGQLPFRITSDSVVIEPTVLDINGQQFSISGQFPDKEHPSRLQLANAHTDYEPTRRMLHDTLSEKLKQYSVDGLFPVQADITLIPGERDSEVKVMFQLSGQDVRVKQHDCRQVYATGIYHNRLDVEDGGIAGSPKNSRIDLDSVDGYLGQMHIRTPYAFLAGTEKGTSLQADLDIDGPAAELGRQLKNQRFFFEEGSFQLDMQADGSLDDMDQLIAGSNGLLHISDTRVYYQPTDVRLRLASVDLHKVGEDVQFQIAHRPADGALAFDLNGRLDNLTPLLLDRPDQQLSSDIELLIADFDWADFIAFFGDGNADSNSGSPTSMRQTLLGLRQTFDPTVDLQIDRVRYYDFFQLHDFSSGLHFRSDTLVLEQTTFDLADSRLTMNARLDFNQATHTPFELHAQTERLDLNQLRPTLAHFGLRLPQELDTLPSALDIDLDHRGRLSDQGGLLNGYNQGKLLFAEGRDKLFSGQLHYTPGPLGLSSRLSLSGDPKFVNTLFAAEDFFFGSGRFQLEAELEGMPENLEELLDYTDLRLRIDSSRIEYRPGDAYFSLSTFEVDVVDQQADFRLDLMTDATRNPLYLRGQLDDLSAFLIPDLERSFTVDADLSASFLRPSDIQELVRSISTDDQAKPMDSKSIFVTAQELFERFRPNLNLAIDTLQWTDDRQLTSLSANLALDSEGMLHLDEAGFRFGDGHVQLSALYPVDNRQTSPFYTQLDIDQIELGPLLKQFDTLDLWQADKLGEMAGTLSVDGTLTGRLDEQSGRVLPNSLEGDLRLGLSDFEILNSIAMIDIGKKGLMKKRFQELRFAPLSLDVSLDSGRIHVPRAEIQNTGAQIFVEGYYHLENGPDLLISIPLRNIGRGLLEVSPEPTGYALSGWKVYLLATTNAEGEPKTKFRLGRRKYYKERGLLEAWRAERRALRAERRRLKRERRARRKN